MQSYYHLFNLPQDLLSTLTPRNLVGQPVVEQPPAAEETPAQPSTKGSTSSTGCNVCPSAHFASVDEQRSHFRSDWHRYNVKVRLSGGAVVGESQFSQLLDKLEESLSGSESSDDDSAEASEEDTVSMLVKKNRRKAQVEEEEVDPTRQQPITALSWFHSPPATQIGVYRNIFNNPAQTPAESLGELKSMQEHVPGGRKWAMFMVAGGHFAGAVIRVSKEEAGEDAALNEGGKRKKPLKPKPDTEVLRHKTFHRYTTRRKQGGSQSLNDNSKGLAKSAGALLRRYGEQALRDDIRALLQDWAEDLYDCERIWIRANVSNRRIFMDYEGNIINKGDERLRGIPFPTRRPTQSEIARCLAELVRVKVSHLTEEELLAQDLEYLASLPKPKPAPKPQAEAPPKPKQPAPPKLSKEEEALREKWDRLLEMISKGRLDSLKSFWDREASTVGGIDTIVPEWALPAYAGKTLLQVAAQAGNEELIRWFLEDGRANPTLKGDQEDRVPYDIAATKEARNVFRRCAAAHPDWWDWFGAAKVPSALTQEMEEEQDEKKRAKRKGLKDRVREREAKEKEKQKSKPAIEEEEVVTETMPGAMSVKTGPRRLGGSAAKGTQDGLVGLTPEMKMRVEREQRARAAEARLKALGGR